MQARDGLPPLGYHAMRLRWCRLALRQWLRRFSVYVVVTAAVVGAGTNSPVAVIAGLAGWLVTPLCLAATQGLWLLPAVALQAAVGAGCVWGSRALLWRPEWADNERALPISPRALRRSDLWLASAALTPLFVLYGFGLAALLAAQPPWLLPVRGRAIVALVAAGIGSLALGTALLQRLRQGRVSAGAQRVPRRAVRAPAAAGRTLGWGLALLVLPLWRGPARRTGHLVWLGTAALLLPPAALLRWPAAASWALALWAAAALVVTTRINALARLELEPVLDACAPLPLRRSLLDRGRAMLSLLPAAVGMTALSATVVWLPLHLGVLAAFLVACSGSALAEVLSRPAEPADKAARWLFCLALCMALATEVMR